MTKPVTRKLAVDCLLDRVIRQFGEPLLSPMDGEPLMPGDPIQFDHIHADVFGGAHEYQNLRPIHAQAHKKKTKRDVQDKSKIDRITGVTGNGPKKKIPPRPFPEGSRKIPSRNFQKPPEGYSHFKGRIVRQ